ncbi:hypothetical protein K503DRAFT_682697, partial [Rhizopogon vinicolor AM-OR11-026]
SIMGSNGSVESNMINALLFVFGYRASSKMLQGKLSELIHNSVRYLDLYECSIDLVRSFMHQMNQPGPDAYPVVQNPSLIAARIELSIVY